MAEGFLKSFDSRLDVISAGTQPASAVHSKAVKAMKLANIDIANNYPKSVNDYILTNFDYLITVCGGANENCPTFIGNIKHKIHIGFDDPAEAIGTEEEIMNEFIRIRDEIELDFKNFYTKQLKAKL